jgi:hypothetical protein
MNQQYALVDSDLPEIVGQEFRRNCLFLAEIIPTIVVIVLDIHFNNHNGNVVLDSFASRTTLGKAPAVSKIGGYKRLGIKKAASA